MASLGAFTRSGDGFTGVLRTLLIDIELAFVPNDRAGDNEKAPELRIVSGASELGAAWRKQSKDPSRELYSVKFDDPALPGPLWASLVEVERDDFRLLWSRQPTD